MNKRGINFGVDRQPRLWLPALAICAGCFILGVLVGTAFSAGFAGSAAAAEYMSGYLSALREGGLAEGFFRSLLDLGWYHAAVFLLGFTMLGAVLIPALAAVRGFTLAFTMAVFVRLYGAGGALTGGLLFGAAALFSVPVLFALSVEAMCASVELVRSGLLRLPPSGPEVYSARYFLRFLAAALLLLILAVGERAIFLSDLSFLPILQ